MGCKLSIVVTTNQLYTTGETKMLEPLMPNALQGLHLQKAITCLVNECHSASLKGGWWYHTPTGLNLVRVVNEPMGPIEELLSGLLVTQKLCLTHSEVSEAMEGHRKNQMDDKLPHRSMLEVELADAVIRIADLAGALKLDLGGALAEKMAYNATRADHKPENRNLPNGKKY